MNRENIVHDIVSVAIASGANTASERISLREGKCIGVIVFTDGTSKAGNNLISIGLKDANKGFVEEPVHVDNYAQPANGYEGLRPVNFIAGRTIYCEFTALNNVPAKTNFQVVFVIDQSEE